ncbi:hypothetical protein CAEBREN_07753 [Caenorhabditis brenneri]|uniref:Uncharacterized protein n=1 Tax=Caenorhabditis brenneri TaxID=135651 RepID=G0NN48_CAEBE|nr:hypothetical protein CAEBREN_07753 [Caenorhabditis brenneri]
MVLPNDRVIEYFQEACGKITPSSLIEKLISFVENDIKSETFENKERFEQWKIAVESLLTQFLIIEAFSIGLQSETKLEELKTLARKIRETLEKMIWNPENWKEDWKKTVTELVEKIQDNNVHQNNSRKADLLRDILEVLFKNYVFYVIVFNDCDYGDNLAIDGTEDQYICSMKRGLCNVIVYRTREWNPASQYERTNFVNQVETCRKGAVPWCADYTGFLGILRNDHIQNTGFLGLLRRNQNPQVRSVNCENDGPGYWITARNKAGEEFILIAGYK